MLCHAVRSGPQCMDKLKQITYVPTARTETTRGQLVFDQLFQLVA